MINSLIVIFVGLAGGLFVGIAFVAFISVLGIIPRLIQLTRTYSSIIHYEWAIITGTVLFSWLNFRLIHFQGLPLFVIIIGLFSGVFVGMLAAALAEVLNVIPILMKRVGIERQLILFVFAIVLGKVCGSLFHWLYFNH